MKLALPAIFLSIVLSFISIAGHAASRQNVDIDGNGLIEINDLADLDEIRNNLDGKALYGSSEGCPTDGCFGFELKADLDFDTNGDGKIDANDEYWNNGEGWEPIGSSSNAFKAVFEGNGHVIRNLNINRAFYVGLFGYADNATIRRVGLTGTLTQITGQSYVGGVLGYGTATHLQGVFASGILLSSSTSSTRMGGVAGYLGANSTIEDSFSTASVTAKYTWVGGLVGWLENSTAKNVFSTGRVSNDGATTYTGGLIGYASSSTVTQSYWATDSSGQSSSAGTSSSNSSYFGATLAELGCASASNNTSCVSGKTLFENWPTDATANNGIAWVFDGNGLPALSLNGKQHRDRDGDGYLDQDDQWPDNYAAAIDFDKDGHPDRWTLGCDDECVTNSGLTLDMFPETAAAWQDDDLDDLPDSWAAGCDVSCQKASGLILDEHLNDQHNGNPPAGIVIVDADHNGLIEIETLEQLDAIRYNLEGTGLKLSANDENNSEGCPPRLVNGQMQRLCKGYELKADLDFDTNGDGKIDESDTYWNGGEGWLPIGSSSNAFKAVFEGNGHVIRNLYIRRPNAYGVGLFGYTNNATIRRVGLTGTLTQITGRSEIGGILGYGIATHLQGVFASGALSSAYTSNAYMGGVAGYLTSNSTIEDSFSTASVTAKNDRVGGLVGYLSNSAVNRAFSTGRVYSDLGSNIGGLIGYASSNIITQSYWATDSSGQSSSAGTSSSNSSYFGATLAELGCASAPNNTSCVSGKTLFENWPTDATANNGIAWVFDGNGLPALSLNGKQHRDRDGDGYLDQDDQWPDNYAAAIDFDKDGYPDRWTLGCDDECVANSGLTLDMFPETAAAWQDDDLDGLPDYWAEGCGKECQEASKLVLDEHRGDFYNGNPVPANAADKDQNGLIDIENLEQLDAIRYNLEGTGLKLSANDENNIEGCPPRLVDGQMQRSCRGYELKADLDFDTNSDGKIDEKDTYWNNGEGWLPIGNNSSGNAFRAIFEGNGHVIRNLYIKRPITSNVGLFGRANNATIRRVGLTGALTEVIGSYDIGGILGYGAATHLQGVFTSGAFSSTYTWNANIGGVAGYLASNSTLEDSFSTASVAAKNTWVGGLVGRLDNSTAKNVFSTGRVSNDGTSSYVGGLIGYASSSPVTQSYWATDSSGQSSSAGTSSSNSSYFGATLAELGCADAPNNTSCVSNKTLFENWPTDAAANGGIAWVFSADQKLPALKLGNNEYRDSDGDGYLDQDDQWPNDYAAAIDADGDGHPDRWTLGCDDECITNSGLTLDMFPETAAAWQDDDLDGFPDDWAVGCDKECQEASELDLDPDPLDPYNGTPPDGIVIIDADHNGLIDIHTLNDLNAIRYNLEGTGLVLTEGGKINVEGCPPRLVNGQMQRLCKGYELKADLDFDTNGDGKIDENDAYWNDEAGWLPIGSSSSGNAFRAIFEGNGHVIRNLYINRPGTSYIGLFGYANNATIRRVGLTGTLMQITGQSYVGGVLGRGTATHLQGVFASGALSSTDNSSAYIGGVAGELMSNSTIEDSFSTASVTAKNDRVGGLVGYLSSSAVSRVFSTGRVHSDRNSSWVGGLIGSSPSSTVTQSYWATDSSGQSSSAGTSSSNSSYFGATLAELGCADAPNNTSCVSNKTLFENWPTDAAANGGIAWVFSADQKLPALKLGNNEYRDSDGDGYLDEDDQWPNDYAAAIDADGDGHPDRWTLGCDDECITNSGLTLDMFPETAAAWQDDDLDGLPDYWADDCNVACKQDSGLTVDPNPLDPYNGTPPDDIVIVDADHNGLIDIGTLEQLNAIRYNLEGTGLKLSANDENNSEGCPPRLVNGQMQRLCKGYELKKDLDFDINDDYLNDGEGWEPIGSSSNAFKAVFEGNGHVIRNLYINRPNASYIGLFGYANNATIRRVGLTGTLTQITGYSNVGGILGYGTATHLQGVFASGALSSANTSTASMGGVAGYLTSNSTLEDSFSIASVTAKGTWIGGLVGYLSSSAVNRAFSIGRVYSDLGSNIGGLIGYASSSPVTQSYWATDSSGQSSSGGTSNSSYFGTTLANLGCASAANNTSCVLNRTLFENWLIYAATNGGIAWVFDSNGLPALSLNGKQHRDRDGDGYLDQDDQFPDNYAAAIDADNDGHPDRWTLGCDDECVTNSGLTLDMFPETAAAWQDDDLDGFPDDWAAGCDVSCQKASGLILDTHLNDQHNGNPPAGIVIVDADHNGLIEIETLEQLDAIRYNLEGTGLKLSANDENNIEGCPPRLVNGQMQRLCKGYELKADLDFDTNGDGKIDESDTYWNGEEGWLPIGNNSNSAFHAVFEGNGHVIRNLYINRPNTSNLGLFGYADNATIRRVGLTGTLTQITGRSYVGGVLGYGKATHLQGVFVSGVLSSAYTSNAYMGGVAGYLELNSTIEDSVSTANVTAKGTWIGGLVGNLYNSTVNRAFSTGRVYSDKTSYVGGLIGYESSSTVTQSYWATDSSGQSRSNGTSNSNPSYFGITLAELGCATSSNNTSCVSGKTLFENWPTNATANNGIAWVFDNTQLVPSLQINGVLHRDNDLDKDGIPNDQDAFPNNPAASVDSDGDGYPDKWNDSCDINCQQNSGLTLDAFPNNPAASVDSDGDGYPDSWNDSCGITCQQNSGLTLDAFPNNPAASVDSDGDGYPDSWNDGCDADCQQNSGLTLDAYLNDFDNDGVPDLLDPDNNADNGAPEMQTVPSERHVSVDTTGVVGLLKYSDLLTGLKAFDAVDGYNLTYQATANDALLTFQTIEDEQYLLVPVGRQVVQWTAKDKSGNQSEPMEQIVNVYPQIGFVKSESITGENSSAGIEMYLSGVSPVYPLDVELEFDLENSTLSQADVAAAIKLSEKQTVQFLAGSTSAKLTINVLSDDEPEADETLLVRLIKTKTNSEENSYFTFNSDLKEHVLTVTEENLPPQVQLLLRQNGKEITEIARDGGDVSIEVRITDPNGKDTHEVSWNLNNMAHVLTDATQATFSPDRLAGGSYTISVTVTDNGNPPESTTVDLKVTVPAAEVGGDDSGVTDNGSGNNTSNNGNAKKSGKGGSVPWMMLVVLILTWSYRKSPLKRYVA